MGQNLIIEPEEEKKVTPKRKKPSAFTRIEKALELGGVFEGGVPIEYFKYVGFLMLLSMGYIWITHKSDRLIRQFEKTKAEVKDLKTDYTTLKKSYMYESKQTEVAKKVKSIGLEPSNQPPYKLIVVED